MGVAGFIFGEVKVVENCVGGGTRVQDAANVRIRGAPFEAQGAAMLRPHNGIGRRTHLG
jgi:hypothetical protein